MQALTFSHRPGSLGNFPSEPMPLWKTHSLWCLSSHGELAWGHPCLCRCCPVRGSTMLAWLLHTCLPLPQGRFLPICPKETPKLPDAVIISCKGRIIAIPASAYLLWGRVPLSMFHECVMFSHHQETLGKCSPSGLLRNYVWFNWQDWGFKRLSTLS